MLIEALARLAHKAGAERVSLEIPPSDGGDCTVLLVPSLGHNARTAEDEKDGALLAALASPIVISGNVGELDSRVVAMIDGLEDDYESAMGDLPETDVQKRRKEIAEAAEKKKSSDKKTNPKKVRSKKSAGKKAEKGTEAEADNTKSHAEQLAAGEADSL